jgi:hypothetical protein
MTTAPLKDAIVVFAARETVEVLAKAVQAAIVAADSVADIEVIINGNGPLAMKFAHLVPGITTGAAKVRVWSIPVADKAHAWNEYVRHIWSGEAIAFFIDGYVRLLPDAVTLLRNAANDSDEKVLGGTGVPSVGRTAAVMRKQMVAGGGFHGNFCCIKGPVIAQLRARHIALPLGLYRVDSLMGAFLSFGLQPELGVWEPKRIVVEPRATWFTDEKHWWSISDLRAKFKQMGRQARGTLENAAVKEHFVERKLSPETLPTDANALVKDWARRRPEQLQTILAGNYLCREQWAMIQKSAPLQAPDTAPVLVFGGVIQ